MTCAEGVNRVDLRREVNRFGKAVAKDHGVMFSHVEDGACILLCELLDPPTS